MTTNMLRTGAAFLESKQKGFCSETATLKRGANTTSIVVQFGSTPAQITDENGFAIDSQITDILCAAADYKISGVAVNPKVGDQFVTASGTFEVWSTGADGCFSYADPYRYRLRIHTQKV